MAVPPGGCAAGTRLATPGGEVSVEHLAMGQRVVLASGRIAPVVWIGHRSYDGRFSRGRQDVLPVRIRAGALGAGVPRRDLVVSPGHGMLLDGVLVPAGLLANGRSITRADTVDAIRYLHVELDRHDALLAEGAAVESFRDEDTRGVFHNAHEHAALYGGRARAPTAPCADRVTEGPVLARIRAIVDARFHLAEPAATPVATDPGG